MIRESEIHWFEASGKGRAHKYDLINSDDDSPGELMTGPKTYLGKSTG